MPPVQPNLDWYKKRGEESKFATAVRCPFASEESCPRYFRSKDELDWKTGGDHTQEKHKELFEKWRATPHWSRAQETRIVWWGDDGEEEPYEYKDFCPEVTLDQFGFAASHLKVYSHKERKDAHIGLSKEQAQSGDWRWTWRDLAAMHYADCPLYAMLLKKVESQAPHKAARASYSKEDDQLHSLIGPEDFQSRTNDEITRSHRILARKQLHRTYPGDSFKCSLWRIRVHHFYPSSSEIRKKRRSPTRLGQ